MWNASDPKLRANEDDFPIYADFYNAFLWHRTTQPLGAGDDRPVAPRFLLEVRRRVLIGPIPWKLCNFRCK